MAASVLVGIAAIFALDRACKRSAGRLLICVEESAATWLVVRPCTCAEDRWLIWSVVKADKAAVEMTATCLLVKPKELSANRVDTCCVLNAPNWH